MSESSVNLPLDLSTLTQQYNQGVPLKYVYFWGHRPSSDGRVTQSCLSQWWQAPFEIDGISYPTTEHYMMAQKALLFDDKASFEKIVQASHPKQAKDLGRKVVGFDEAVWQAHRFDIVVAGNVAKFSQNPELKAYLLGTGNRVLVEASPVDKIWGVGLAKTDVRIYNPEQWQGLNLLGFALMIVRDRLKGERS